MHKEVRKFCESIQSIHPFYFSGGAVLDCGSLDINGNNRYLFDGCQYTGIDIVAGRNVDVVTRIHEFSPGKTYKTVISTEMLEHDEYWRASLQNMFALTQPGGLLLLTAAGTGRPEHGTSEHHPGDSPLTHGYYKNITAQMIAEALDLDRFCWFIISYVKNDIRFAGIKIA